MRSFAAGVWWVVLPLALDASGASAQAQWTLADVPDLVIGSADGSTPPVFHDIRGVIALGDGIIAIANGGTREIRTYSTSGVPLSTFGREGDGPREFRGIHWIDTCGDTAIVAFDTARDRITRWDAHGTLLKGFPVESPEPDLPAYSVSCGPAGRFAVMGWPDIVSYGGGVGPYRAQVMIGVADADGHITRILGTFAGPERYRYLKSDGPRPLGKSTIVRMGSNAVYIGTADTYEITKFDLENGARSTFGIEHAVTELTPALVEVWRDSIIERARPDRRPAVRKALSLHELPSSLPAYSDFVLDRLGFVWVTRYGVPGQGASDWDVFDPDGGLVGSLAIPITFRPTDIGADYVLGVHTDALGVQRVHRYRLSRSGTGARRPS